MTTNPFDFPPAPELGPYYTLSEFDDIAEFASSAMAVTPSFFASPDFLVWAKDNEEAGQLLGFGFHVVPTWRGRVAGITTTSKDGVELQVLPFDNLGERFMRQWGDEAILKCLPDNIIKGNAKVFTDEHMPCPRADRIYRGILKDEEEGIEKVYLSAMASSNARYQVRGWPVEEVMLPLPFEFAMFVGTDGNTVLPLSWRANNWLEDREEAAQKRLGEVFLGEAFSLVTFEWEGKALLG